MADSTDSLMTISVIMPVYNEDSGLAHTLTALVEAGDWHELLVVDASSDVHCQEQLESCLENPQLPTHTRLIRDAGRGRARQMNAGAAAASGETLLFLHADTLLPAGASQLIEDALTIPPVGERRAQSATAVWGRFDVRFDTDHGWLWWVARLMNIRSHRCGVVTGDQAMFVRREMFVDLGGFAEIALMEDIEISKRLKRRSWPRRIKQPVITSGRRWREDGPIRTIVLMWMLRLGYFVGVAPSTLARWYRHTRRSR